MRALHPATALLFAVLATSCVATGPRKIEAGQDACAYCRMEITDPRFGAQVITRTGRIYVFDAVECAAGFVRATAAESILSVWVADAESGRFVPVETAGFLRDASLQAPMGRTVAFADAQTATREQARVGGTAMTWVELLADSISAHGDH